MTLLLEKQQLLEKGEMDIVRKKLAEIESLTEAETGVESHIHIMNLDDYLNYGFSKSAIPSANYPESEGWGELANHYRIFYIAVSGQTESGFDIIGGIQKTPRTYNIPHYEGDELLCTCKRDLAFALIDFVSDSRSIDEIESKISKSILRAVEACRLKIGEMPAFSDEGVYFAIAQKGKILAEMNVIPDYSIIERALNVKLGKEKYGVDEKYISQIIRLFNNFNSFFIEQSNSKETFPIESYLNIKNYSKDTVKKLIKKYKNQKLKPLDMRHISLFMGEDIIELAEKNPDDPDLKDILKIICKPVKTACNLSEIMGLPGKFLYELAGRTELLMGNYAESEKLLIKSISLPGVNKSFYAMNLSLHESSVKGKLAMAKYCQGDVFGAKKVLKEAVNGNPLDSELWEKYFLFYGVEDYKKIANLITDYDSTDNIFYDNNLNSEVKKLFLEVWENYLSNSLQKDKTYLSHILAEINTALDKNEGLLEKIVCRGKLSVVHEMAEKTADMINTLNSDNLTSVKSYKTYLSEKWNSARHMLNFDKILEILHDKNITIASEIYDNQPGIKTHECYLKLFNFLRNTKDFELKEELSNFISRSYIESKYGVTSIELIENISNFNLKRKNNKDRQKASKIFDDLLNLPDSEYMCMVLKPLGGYIVDSTLNDYPLEKDLVCKIEDFFYGDLAIGDLNIHGKLQNENIYSTVLMNSIKENLSSRGYNSEVKNMCCSSET